MDKQLFTLIRSYIGAVARATAVLEAADIDLPTSCDEWAATPILRVGRLVEVFVTRSTDTAVM